MLRKEEKAFTKQEVRDVLNAILGLEWMGQSGGKQPIQLTPRLITVLQAATSLSTEDLSLLWQKAPRTPSKALQNLDHSLPDTASSSVMDKLQSAKLSLVTFGGKPTAKGEEQGTPASPAQKVEVVSGIEGKEKLFKAIVNALQDKESGDKSQGTEALKTSLEALLETEEGKKIKERMLELLLGGKGLPFTALVASAGLAAIVANNTDIPSTPEIPLSDNLSLKAEFEGTFQQPKGIKFVAKLTFGGPPKQEGSKKPGVLELPPNMLATIGRIDRKTLIQWFVQQAYAEYEMAGPQEEEAKKEFYIAARDRPHALGLPDAQAVAEGLARKLLERAIENRISQLKGTEMQKQVEFVMGHAEQWGRFPQLAGLAVRLEWLLGLLIPEVPYKALGIEEVVFGCGEQADNDQGQETMSEIKKEEKARRDPGLREPLRPVVAEPTGSVPGWPAALTEPAVGDGSTETQAAWLSDSPLQRAQRQALVSQIGRTQGNRHLLTVMASLAEPAIGRRAGKVLPRNRIARLVPYNETETDARFADPELASGVLPFAADGWDGCRSGAG